MPVQIPRDRILWVLSENGCQMDMSELRRLTGLRNATIYPLLQELAEDGIVRIDGNNIALKRL
ncbi:MAG: hypothetical protein A4E48_00081 [Methanosaeta sp. PtaU1.Bin060]|nr:MAG: hypothetical protein A4E48_00081 [Methanosaeta sp. PtaU1.Bin060]